MTPMRLQTTSSTAPSRSSAPKSMSQTERLKTGLRHVFAQFLAIKKIAFYALLGSASLVLSACESGAKPAFQGVDITGARYAQGFSLSDHNGQTRTLADFAGKAVIVFFGYTHCPDVCPTSMLEMAEVKKRLGADGARLQGLFISLDPERDRPDMLQAYMAAFDPSFIALLPAPEDLPKLAKDFRIYYKKVPGQTPGSYTLDHSASSYLYDPQGRLRVFHKYQSGADAVAADVRLLLKE